MEMMLEFFPHVRVFVIVVLVALISVAVANIVDCVDAIHTSRVAGQKMESAKLRHAMWKLAKEWAFMLVVLCVDTLMALCWTKLPYLTVVCALAMVAVEIISMYEHAMLRKDKLTKLPSTIKELVEYFGEDDLKALLQEFVKRKMVKD